MLSFAAIKLLRVKEAYRVLAGKDPSRIAPHKIEEFLGQADLLRKKVLDQFARYRTEWRNPFHARLRSRFRRGRRPDGNRICTVFAIVLCDQIDGNFLLTLRRTHERLPPPRRPGRHTAV